MDLKFTYTDKKDTVSGLEMDWLVSGRHETNVSELVLDL